jgi:hypothetical protein
MATTLAIAIDATPTERLLTQSINQVNAQRALAAPAGQQSTQQSSTADTPNTSHLTLYAIEEHLAALCESVETVTPDQEQQFLVDFQAALTSAADKRDRVAHMLSHLEHQQAFAAAEIKRLQEFKRSAESAQNRLEGYVTYCIDALGRDAKGKYRKLEGHTTVMFLRASPASVDVLDEAAIPEQYKRATVTIAVDKRAVKAAIENGEDVPGAKLVTDKTSLGRK